MQYTLYTDGGCHMGTGSWAFVLLEDGVKAKAKSGLVTETTNNRMEVMAILQGAVELLSVRRIRARDANVIIRSDSKYAIAAIQGQNQVLANSDLIMPARQILRGIPNVSWRWVKGHSGDPWNDLADSMCTEVINNHLGCAVDVQRNG